MQGSLERPHPPYSSIHCSLTILLFMLCISCMSLVSSLYLMHGAAHKLDDFIEIIHGSELDNNSFTEHKHLHHHIDKFRYNNENFADFISTIAVIVLTTGLTMRTIVGGVFFRTQFIVTSVCLTLALLQSCVQGYFAYDLSQFPNDTHHLIDGPVIGFLVASEMTFEAATAGNRSLLERFSNVHRMYRCCGFFNVDDFLTGRTISYKGKHNNLIEFFSLDVSHLSRYSTINSSNPPDADHVYVPIAPRFCCKYISNDGCNRVKVDGELLSNGKSVDIEWDNEKLFSVPCIRAILWKQRSLNILVSLLSALFSLVAIIHLINLCHLKSKKRVWRQGIDPALLANFLD